MAGTYAEEIRLREENEEALIKKKVDGLRDRMAMVAMNGLLSNHAGKESCFPRYRERIAEESYRIADVMLEARQKNQKDQGEGTQP